MFTWFNWFSLLMSGWFPSLGLIAGRRDIRRPLLYGGLLYLVAIAVVTGIDQHLRSYMMDDKGG